MPDFAHANEQSETTFDACLRADGGKIYETGRASIYMKSGVVDFENDFVPLMVFNAPATIIRLVDGNECHSYTGSIYLSSRTRLQIANVKDKLLTPHELSISLRVEMEGRVFGIVMVPSSKSDGASKKALKTTPVEIFSLSKNEIGFTVPTSYQETATQLLLHIDYPMMATDIEVVTYRQLQFNSEKIACYAKIVSMPDSAKRVITRYMEEKLLLFP